MVDCRLTFTDHNSSCCNKAAKQVNTRSRLSKTLHLTRRKLIFRSLEQLHILPHRLRFWGEQNNRKVKETRTCNPDSLPWIRHTAITIKVYVIHEVSNSYETLTFHALKYVWNQCMSLPKWFTETDRFPSRTLFPLLEINCGTNLSRYSVS